MKKLLLHILGLGMWSIYDSLTVLKYINEEIHKTNTNGNFNTVVTVLV